MVRHIGERTQTTEAQNHAEEKPNPEAREKSTRLGNVECLGTRNPEMTKKRIVVVSFIKHFIFPFKGTPSYAASCTRDEMGFVKALIASISFPI